MIANVSPSAETFEDTFNTLKYENSPSSPPPLLLLYSSPLPRYADRAKKIKINLKANVLTVNFQLGQYTKIVEVRAGPFSGLFFSY